MSETLKWTDERLSQLRTLWDEGFLYRKLARRWALAAMQLPAKYTG